MNTNQDASIVELLGDVAQESSTLVRQEMALARAEVREGVDGLLDSLTTIVIGLVFCIAGAIYLLQAAMFGLAEIMPEHLRPWLPALIVGLIALVIGYISIKIAKKKITPERLLPSRAVGSVRQDVNEVRGALNE